MAVTVRQTLKLGGFSQCKLLAGADGLDNPISYAGNMEIPDIKPWLSKNQLLMTTGYALRHDSSAITELVQDLHDAGCSALAIKTRFTGPIPKQALELADALGMPVIEIPAQIPFIDMMGPLTKAISDEHGKMLEFSQNIHAKFIELEINGGGLNNIISMIAKLMDASVKILTEKLETIASECAHWSTINNEFETFSAGSEQYLANFSVSTENNLCFSSEESIPKFHCVIRKIFLRNEIKGYLFICTRKKIDQMDAIIIDHATTVCTLEFSKLMALQEQHKLMENNLLIDIISGNIKSEEEVMFRAFSLKWPSPPFSIVVFDVDNFENVTRSKTEVQIQVLKEKVKEIIERNLYKNKSGVPIINKSDSFSCLIAGAVKRENIEQGIISVIGQVNERLNVMLTAGACLEVESYSRLTAAYHDVRDAIIISRATKSPKHYTFICDSKFEQAMLHLSQNEYLINLVNGTIKKLAEYDSNNHTDLTTTLAALIDNMGVRTKTANQLFMHRNTLVYRLKKIEAITGYNLSDPNDIFALGIALKAETYISYSSAKASHLK